MGTIKFHLIIISLVLVNNLNNVIFFFHYIDEHKFKFHPNLLCYFHRDNTCLINDAFTKEHVNNANILYGKLNK